jgi:hypothetical protein
VFLLTIYDVDNFIMTILLLTIDNAILYASIHGQKICTQSTECSKHYNETDIQKQ